jgi:RNA-directed DNA polymerase
VKLSALRFKLYEKAKREPRFRFYTLWDRIWRSDTLRTAYNLVTTEAKAPGVDGITRDHIERAEGGVDRFLADLQESLRTKKYQPQMVRRTYIPKPNGDLRPLGIPTLRDRVAQRAALLILEPIFEADFEDCSHGFRPGRSAHDALRAVRGYLSEGYREVYDADLKGYFDSIPHDKLMKGIEQRISDRTVLSLIRSWLRTLVVEQPTDEDGRPKGPPQITRPTAGTPQGGVISPLLANTYLHWMDRAFHGERGPSRWAKAKLVRYADDFVILARYVGDRLTGWVEEVLEGRLGLTLNRSKTRVVNLAEGGATLNFLGYSFRYDRDLRGRDRRYLNVFPAKKSVTRMRDKVRALTGPSACFKPLRLVVGQVSHLVGSWANYFGGGYPAQTFRDLEAFVRCRLIRHANRRSQRGYRKPADRSWYRYLRDLGLASPPRPKRDPLALQGVSSSCRESRMREICTSGSTGEEWAA